MGAASASTSTMLLLPSTSPSFALPPPFTRDGGYLPRATAASSRYERQCTSRQSRKGELPGHSGLLCSRTRSRQARRLCDRKLSAVGSHGLAARHHQATLKFQRSGSNGLRPFHGLMTIGGAEV